MSRPRALSEAKTPHSVSLKVLRLSAPQLAHQFPLPPPSKGSSGADIDPRAALAYPSKDAATHDFILAPILTLPPAFGATHVGETFVCTLCVNNETTGGAVGTTLTASTADRGGHLSVSGIKISAEMQTPGQSAGVALQLGDADGADETDQASKSTASLQRIVRWDLREEGTHVLAVTVTYSETHESGDGSGGALGGKVRTFRKLYQFVARPLLNVRTKTQRLPRPSHSRSGGGGGGTDLVLEAQLENVSETPVTVGKVQLLEVAAGLQARSLNRWDDQVSERPRLNPRDVLQVAFMLRQKEAAETEASDPTLGNVPVGRLEVSWTGSMGDRGSLATGGLTCRR